MTSVLFIMSILRFLLLSLLITYTGGSVIIQVEPAPERECSGTNSEFSYSGSARYHYDQLRMRYEGCTVVRGNLELTALDDLSIDYDLGFLQTIRTVTGYVLIGLNYAEVLPFLNLQLIRGDNLFQIPTMNQSYALAVALTADPGNSTGLRQLLMPALREISRGQVLFYDNPLLCYINTINWDDIVRQHDTPVYNTNQADRQDCEPCDDYCSVNGQRRCWGPGPHNCQQVSNVEPCPNSCLSGCYQSNGVVNCCHELCAGGCWGPSDRDCQLCKYYSYQNRCYGECPPGTNPLGQQCRSFSAGSVDHYL